MASFACGEVDDQRTDSTVHGACEQAGIALAARGWAGASRDQPPAGIAETVIPGTAVEVVESRDRIAYAKTLSRLPSRRRRCGSD